MHLHDKYDQIIKGRENDRYRGIDSLSFNPYFETPMHENYIPIEVIDQSIENLSSNLRKGIKSKNKVNSFTVTPQDYDKIMRSDRPM